MLLLKLGITEHKLGIRYGNRNEAFSRKCGRALDKHIMFLPEPKITADF